MTIQATSQWWVRVAGDNLNGGGFDAGISGAGTNYCDQDAAQLSLTDLACVDSTTLTSVTGGFTTAMIGNCIRIASGTNFVPGYYFVTARTDTNTVTVDRKPVTGGTTGSGGTGRLGGAFAHYVSIFNNGGSVSLPTITTPLAAGHIINVRGSGSDDPSSADYTQTGYAQYPSGNTTDGYIQFKGYNGRPRLHGDALQFYQLSGWRFNSIYVGYSGTSNGNVGAINGFDNTLVFDSEFDQGGYDVAGLVGGAVNCKFINTGSTSSGSYYAITGVIYNTPLLGNTIDNWRGGGISCSSMSTIIGNTITRCRSSSLRGISIGTTSPNYCDTVAYNTIDNNAGDGIEIGVYGGSIYNNILTRNLYGIRLPSGTALNERLRRFIDYNVFGAGSYANASGTLLNLSAGAHDQTIDPLFVDAANGNFTPQEATLEGTAFPTSLNGISSFGWPGAIQPKGGGSLVFIRRGGLATRF